MHDESENGREGESEDSGMPSAGRYAREIDLDSESTHSRVVGLVGRDRRVLELGPGPGHMTTVLQELGCSIVGIEADPEAAQLANRYCERMIVGDLDELDLASELGAARFDVVVAADVLEHLKDPLRVLQRLRPFLHPEGFFVISLPNIAHGSVRLALLEGSFPYQDAGLLDRTHLRFFTRKSIDTLLDDAELGAAEIFRQPLDVAASEVPFDAETVPAGVMDLLAEDPDARTYQFVIKAIPIAVSGMREMQGRMREMAHETALMRDRNAELETQVSELRSGMGDVSIEAQQRADELRRALIEAHDQVLRRDEQINRLQEETARLRDETGRLRGELDAIRKVLEAAHGEAASNRDQALRLRIRLERITSSPPMRAYQMLGQLPGLKTVKASRTAGYKRALRGAGGQPDPPSEQSHD